MTIERASGAGAEPGPLPPFETPLAILPGDVDELGHVNNVVYLRWIQELAIAHWNSGTTTDERAALVWVVARHEVDYERPVLPGDAVIGRTWIGAQVGRHFERLCEIVRGADGRRFAKSRTLWCPIDPATGRTCRVPDSIRARFSTGVAPGAERPAGA